MTVTVAETNIAAASQQPRLDPISEASVEHDDAASDQKMKRP